MPDRGRQTDRGGAGAEAPPAAIRGVDMYMTVDGGCGRSEAAALEAD